MIEKLHTIARRYCIERYQYWYQKYFYEIVKTGKVRAGNKYTDQAYQIFPRYNVLSAILTEVERFVPEDFSSLKEAREIIGFAGSSAESSETQSTNSIEKDVIEEERIRFTEFITNLTIEELETVKPLPFRRVLSKKESQALWIELKQAWGEELVGCHKKFERILVFPDQIFFEKIGTEGIQALLFARDLNRIFELKEYGPEFEIDISLIEVSYGGCESFWFSGEMDWIVLSHHHGYIGVGGSLLEEIAVVWPTWKEWASSEVDMYQYANGSIIYIKNQD